MEVSADWALADQTRTFCLLVLDMENDYLPCAARTDARTFARLTRSTLCGASHTAAQRRCQLSSLRLPRRYMTFMMPNAEAVLAAFRKAQQPVVWTNWYRQEDDGAYGACARPLPWVRGRLPDASTTRPQEPSTASGALAACTRREAPSKGTPRTRCGSTRGTARTRPTRRAARRRVVRTRTRAARPEPRAGVLGASDGTDHGGREVARHQVDVR
jgi:hypothetical protein